MIFKFELYNADEFDMFENTDDVGTLLASGKEDENLNKDEDNKPGEVKINLSDKYKENIPYTYINDADDDDIMNLDLF